MDRRQFSVIVMITLVLSVAMACSLVSGISQRAEQAQQTAQALATQASRGGDAVATLQAGVTEVAGSKLVETAQALAATVAGSGPAQTARAMATEKGPGLFQTAVAAATEEIPGLVETARAYITEQGPGALETAQAVATRIAGGSGEMPADIPVVSGPTENFYATGDLLMYQTEQPFDQVLAFYKVSMPAEGWLIDLNKSVETEKTAILQYSLDGRVATIALNFNPVGEGTIVLITVANP